MVVNTGESSSPHGVALVPGPRSYQSSKEMVALLLTTSPASSYTQWRGNVVAPAMEPSARAVGVQLEPHRRPDGGRDEGGRPRPTRRGAGIPGRPPAVWVKITEVSPTSGSGRRSGNPCAWNVKPSGPTRMWVLFRTPPPLWPWATMRPSSTSIHPARWLANRRRSASRSAPRSSRLDVVRRRGVVVADLQLERELGDAADRLGRDPRHRGDRRLDAHPPNPRCDGCGSGLGGAGLGQLDRRGLEALDALEGEAPARRSPGRPRRRRR